MKVDGSSQKLTYPKTVTRGSVKRPQVFGDARVFGDAHVSGDAVVCDNGTKVYEKAQVAGQARVHRGATIYGEAIVCDNARVEAYAHIRGDALIHGWTEVASQIVVERGNIDRDRRVYGPVP